MSFVLDALAWLLGDRFAAWLGREVSPSRTPAEEDAEMEARVGRRRWR